MKIILIGCQGSGKSTQAELLGQKLSLPLLSTGNLCRQTSQESSPLGRKVKEMMNKGVLVDDQTILQMVKKFLKEKGRAGFIAEGFPRNLAQAKAFLEKIDYVFYIKLSPEEAIRRLTARWICSQCKANFNLLTAPPKKKGVCDSCAAPLIQRDDDQQKAVKKRLELYFQQTEPVLDYYREQRIVHDIDGAKSISAIHKDIIKVIESRA